MRVLGLCGSLRAGSHNRKLLSAAASKLPAGVEFRTYDRLGEFPQFSEEVVPTEAVLGLRKEVVQADALLLCTPEYNGSTPGLFKNAIDWASWPVSERTFDRKPVAVIGATVGMFGAIWAQADLRRVMNTIGADVVGEELPVAQVDQAFTQDGRLADPDLDATLGRIVRALLDKVGSAVSPGSG